MSSNDKSVEVVVQEAVDAKRAELEKFLKGLPSDEDRRSAAYHLVYEILLWSTTSLWEALGLLQEVGLDFRENLNEAEERAEEEEAEKKEV